MDNLQAAIDLYKQFCDGNNEPVTGYVEYDRFLYHTYNHPDADTFDMKNYEIVVLMSGGIDSFIAYKYAKSKYGRVTALFVNYGQVYADVELRVCKELFKGNDDLKTIDISAKMEKDAAALYGEIFPGRNWILSIAAADYIEKRGQIWMSAVGGEVKELWGDKSQHFFTEGTRWLTALTNKQIIIDSPFKYSTKGQIIKWYLAQGYPLGELRKTVSCHFVTENNKMPCGRCMGCAHRYVAMQYNRITETYNDNVKEYARRIYGKETEDVFSQFGDQRLKEIRKALKPTL